MNTKFIRKGRVIKNIEDNSSKKFEFINQAKRESHKLQMANGGLGNGSLRVG